MFKILLVGHGSFPVGFSEALDVLVGHQESVMAIKLDEENDHEMFEEQMRKFLTENDEVVIFSDLTGGAPHTITARIMMELKKPSLFLISAAPLVFLMQIVLELPNSKKTPKEVKAFLQETLDDSLKTAKVMNF